ncbi:hypothetical protein M9H77_36707 [Catharanthus roseus]|uniref:Uncharacterized protein n=1 Tax=Catharanthus roseus TaxID=4058 RepID=A0ACB9ZWU9_CATRO|nr:hypothetical protein M9H77_36707 [Catharanthus roseus]
MAILTMSKRIFSHSSAFPFINHFHKKSPRQKGGWGCQKERPWRWSPFLSLIGSLLQIFEKGPKVGQQSRMNQLQAIRGFAGFLMDGYGLLKMEIGGGHIMRVLDLNGGDDDDD